MPTAAPSTKNYAVGKGKVYFTKEGGERRHVGNVAELEITVEIEELEHFSSMEGTRVKDLVVVLEKSGQIRMVMEEWVPENMEIALLGAMGTNTEGNITIDILSEDLIRGKLEFEATNSVGPKWDYVFPSIAFRPSGAIAPITSEWGQLEVEGEIEAVEGKFGTATLQDSAVTEAATEEPTA